MNDTAVLTSVTVSTAYYPDEVLHMAQSALQGCYDDYYFFQYNSTDYCLFVGDLQFSDNSVTADECLCYQFRRFPQIHTQTVSIPFSGNQSGQYGGSDGAGGFTGSLSGSSQYQVTNTTYELFCDTYTAYNVSVSNSADYLVYGSAPNLPHLIEGVENYAYLAVCCFVAVCVFKLSDRLFRRVY